LKLATQWSDFEDLIDAENVISLRNLSLNNEVENNAAI